MRPILLSVFLACSALAQNPAPPAFEVASVKISPTFQQGDRSMHMDRSPGSLTFRNMNLTMLIAWAHHLQWPQIVGPAGMDAQRYDVLAKAAGPATDDEMRPMLQALLAERFKLVVHRETRQLEVLAILLPKSGTHKMTESKVVEGEGGHRQDPVRGTVIEGAELAQLGDELAREAGAPIVDMTGLKGRFDFTFNVPKYVEALRARVMADPQHVPPEAQMKATLMQDLFAGELGLRLEPRKAPVEVLVIDRFEKSPVEN
jgi:uncharacterized protein (TIGR03435 family)